MLIFYLCEYVTDKESKDEQNMTPEHRSFYSYGYKFEEYVTKNIEVKVCAEKPLDGSPFRYNRKFANWWIESFFVGIKTMVLGLRDTNGIVNTLSLLTVSEMKQAATTWSRQSFFNFFLCFADFLAKHVTNEYSLNHKDVALFHFRPLAEKITVEKSSDSKYHFILD